MATASMLRTAALALLIVLTVGCTSPSELQDDEWGDNGCCTDTQSCPSDCRDKSISTYNNFRTCTCSRCAAPAPPPPACLVCKEKEDALGSDWANRVMASCAGTTEERAACANADAMAESVCVVGVCASGCPANYQVEIHKLYCLRR